MPLPRMTTRRWMIVVAVVGIVLGVTRMTWLFSRARRRRVTTDRFRLDMRLPMDAQIGKPGVRRFHAYHQAMRAKWEHAARRPWLPRAAPIRQSPGEADAMRPPRNSRFGTL